LTSYKIEGDLFHGRLEMPIAVGTKGGAISTSPVYINTHMIMDYPTTE
jgi:hydroxymethylglutaryl-CoA reductase